LFQEELGYLPEEAVSEIAFLPASERVVVITLTIDGKQVKAKEGMSVLEAAQEAGIYIPALCYHPSLPSDGSSGFVWSRLRVGRISHSHVLPRLLRRWWFTLIPDN